MAFLNRGFFALFLVLYLSRAAIPLASELELVEQKIKVGMLYNFLKYTQWPDSAANGIPLAVCVLGSDPFDGNLQPIEQRSVNRRAITLRVIQNAKESESCHLLYISAKESARWPALREFVANRHVLTVSDSKGFSAAGGMIEFGHSGDHIRALLNMDAVKFAGLSIEDRLLRLVTVVPDEARGE